MSPPPGPSPPASRARAAADLVLVSFLALFLELALIRWIPGCIKMIGYYTNLVLISSVLGLGLGCAAPPSDPGPARSRPLAFPFRLLVSLSLYAGVQYLGTLPLPDFWGEHLWLAGKLGPVPSFLMPELVFAANAWTFLPLGRGLGDGLRPFPPLTGYGLNLAGGLAGTIALTAGAAVALGPVWWFALAAAAYLAWLAAARVPARSLGLAAALLAGALLAVFIPARGKIWSPYYKITITSFDQMITAKTPREKELVDSLGAMALSVNDDYFQFAVNLDPVVLAAAEKQSRTIGGILRDLGKYIGVPYAIHPGRRVLILGSGLGNDVAAAIRGGAREIDAVEIDPRIIALGRERHPEQPYSNPKVRVHNTDARRFLREARGPYDLIVYGFLDSHAVFSAFSSVRLDTFVYTRESFEDAARLLAPDGVMVVMFTSSRNFVGERLFAMVRRAFPRSARAWSWRQSEWGFEFDIIAGGPGLRAEPGLAGAFQDITALFGPVPAYHLPTDDWPFLYLKNRWISPGYGLTLLVLLAISATFARKVLPGLGTVDRPFFLLGAAFMLLETKSITEMSLLFGSTWTVNAAVISAFLAMSMLACIWAARFPLPRLGRLYALLFAAIAAAFVLPMRALLFESWLVSGIAGGSLAALPVLFSGLVFAAMFRDCPDPARALGSNILGLVAGGMAEYLSLTAGFKALYLLAAAFYLGAWWTRRK